MLEANDLIDINDIRGWEENGKKRLKRQRVAVLDFPRERETRGNGVGS